jgi:hypothetical protein
MTSQSCPCCGKRSESDPHAKVDISKKTQLPEVRNTTQAPGLTCSGTILSSRENDIDIARTHHLAVHRVSAGSCPEFRGIAYLMGSSRPVREPFYISCFRSALLLHLSSTVPTGSVPLI